MRIIFRTILTGHVMTKDGLISYNRPYAVLEFGLFSRILNRKMISKHLKKGTLRRKELVNTNQWILRPFKAHWLRDIDDADRWQEHA